MGSVTRVSMPVSNSRPRQVRSQPTSAPTGLPTRMAADYWRNLQPVLAHVGVTRVADVTWLDDVGIPCAQAIRPQARTLSVAQGKGLSRLDALTAAAMEAIELWHAENLVQTTRATVRSVAPQLGYPLGSLRVRPTGPPNLDAVVDWTPASELTTGRDTLVPTELVRLDSVIDDKWVVPYFEASSNGLASAATRDAAVLHALCEVVERDALAQGPSSRLSMDIRKLPAAASTLADLLTRPGHQLSVDRLIARVQVPTFAVSLTCDDFPIRFVGSATHVDTDAALCAALAEVAQARVAYIAGTREDLNGEFAQSSTEGSPTLKNVPSLDAASRTPICTTLELVRAIAAVSGHPPMLVDLTRPDLGIPVVKVICPGLACPWDY